MSDNSTHHRSVYESFALFFNGKGGVFVFFAGMIGIPVFDSISKRGSYFGFGIGRILGCWFFGFLGLFILGQFLGWEEIAERKRLEGKLKPIPLRGKKIELYEINSGKPLGFISENELQYLIDSFKEFGMPDNDFYILRETVDLFEERGADHRLIVTLREMMGEKNDMEIGWTRV
jgi:hypothetical protein